MTRGTSRLSKSAFLSTFFLSIWVTVLKRQSRTDISSSSFSWPLPIWRSNRRMRMRMKVVRLMMNERG